MQNKVLTTDSEQNSSAFSGTEKASLLDLIQQKDSLIEQQKRQIETLKEALILSRVKRFTRSSEQSDGQYSLFDEAEMEVYEQEHDSEDSSISSNSDDSKKDKDKKKTTGRKPFSKDIPRVPVYLDLTEEEKAGASKVFYTKVKEELDIIPAKIQVLEYYQQKAIFNQVDDKKTFSLKAAVLPKHPFPKAMGSINLMAYVIIAKYADGLPLYRLEGILQRYGGEMSRATLANWMIKLATQLQPLINLLRESQIAGDIIQMDETTVKVLKEPDKPATSDKYMWVSRGGPPGQPSVLFEYDPSRSGEVPVRLLDDFSGYLQTDGYSGYNAVCAANKITSVGCWDHARRKFKDAQSAQPKKKKGNKPTKADIALSMINKLYLIEREIKERTIEKKYLARQEQSLPLLKKLDTWLENNYHKVPKDSLTGKAMTYAINQWDKLNVYCKDGRLNISNVLAENAIRPFVVGRKAWLFSDTPKGAYASSVHYSLIETAKANGVEPHAYLVEVLNKIPYADSVEKIEELLPWNFKKSLDKKSR
jgi:transposase